MLSLIQNVSDNTFLSPKTLNMWISEPMSDLMVKVVRFTKEIQRVSFNDNNVHLREKSHQHLLHHLIPKLKISEIVVGKKFFVTLFSNLEMRKTFIP